jgi:hypothetical protein
MRIDLSGTQSENSKRKNAEFSGNKKTGTNILVPALSWLVSPDKNRENVGTAVLGCPLGKSGCLNPKTLLRGPSWPDRQIPHLGQDAGHLHPVQL